MRDMGLAGALYVAFIIGGALVMRSFDPPQWMRVVLALAPLAPVALILRAVLVFIKSVDEFQRRLHMEAILITSGLTAFGTFAYGLLEEWADLPHLSVMWILPAMMLAWGAALWLIRRRYK
jgi:hypothetical protein